MRKFFNTLDEDGGGTISIEELEEPLIGLGVAANRGKISLMFDALDADSSGDISFEEFLRLLKGGRGDNTISKFFKEMISGKLKEDLEDMPFRLLVSAYRR